MFIHIAECQGPPSFSSSFSLFSSSFSSAPLLFLLFLSATDFLKVCSKKAARYTAKLVTFWESTRQDGNGAGHQSIVVHTPFNHTRINLESPTSLICMFLNFLQSCWLQYGSRRSGISSSRLKLHWQRRWLLGYGEIPKLIGCIHLWRMYALWQLKGQMWASCTVNVANVLLIILSWYNRKVNEYTESDFTFCPDVSWLYQTCCAEMNVTVWKEKKWPRITDVSGNSGQKNLWGVEREKGRHRHLLSWILWPRSAGVFITDISEGYIAVWQEPLWEWNHLNAGVSHSLAPVIKGSAPTTVETVFD